MKSIFASILILLIGLGFLNAQVVTSDPAFPSESNALTIYFYAAQGTGGLKDHIGDIYAHTGVITENSTSGTDWKYVKTDWPNGSNSATVNIQETRLTKVSDNLYSLEIAPSLREYYNVPPEEEILQMAFVFRNETGSITGKDDGGADIFVDLYTGAMTVEVISPNKNIIVDPLSEISFVSAASESATIDLYLNNDLIKTETTTSLTHVFNLDTPGDYWMKVFATTAEQSAADSVLVHVLGTQVTETIPDGLVDGINYVNNQTAQLVLYAPGKQHVFAVGDFNAWAPSVDARMKKDGDRYWITISGLTEGEEYAFQYYIDGEILLADPYTEKVLDPSNDKWIQDATYPNLKEYPHDFTTGLASVLQTGQQEYAWEQTNFTPPEKDKLVIYEMLLRDFLATHDWKTLTDTLDYFSKLGVNAIEIMPFNEFEGNESWGYNVSFYFAPDKYYGPKEDLQAFIDSCHGRGIAVIMDMVLNHSYSQSPFVQLYFNPATFKVTEENPWYNVESPNSAYSWGYDFDHESQATKDLVDRVNGHWLNEYNLDGFRFDFTKGFTNTPGDGGSYDAARIAILKRMADEIWNENPNAYVIFEHFAANNEEIVLSDHGMMIWGNITGNYGEAAMGWHENGKSDFNWISYKNRGWNDPRLVGYMESHDEERLMFKNLSWGNANGSYNTQNLSTALARMELAGAFFFTIPGPKMIWQFGELGYDYSIDENGRVGNKPIRWDYYGVKNRKKLYDVYSALIHLKTSEPAFSTSDFNMDVSGALKRIELNHSDMDVRIIGNFDVIETTIDPSFSQTGNWFDYFRGETLNVTGVHELITLSPGEYRIYTTKQLEQPVIIDKVEKTEVLESGTTVYPVPATAFLYVSTSSETTNLSIYDINGRLVTQHDSQGLDQTINVEGLNSGVYFMRIGFENEQVEYLKFIKE